MPASQVLAFLSERRYCESRALLDNARELLLTSLGTQVFVETHTDVTNQQTTTQGYADLFVIHFNQFIIDEGCLLYTSDAADE